MPLPLEKDIDVLRAAHQRLSDQLARTTLARFAVLFALLVSFGRAFEQIDTPEVSDRQTAIETRSGRIKTLRSGLRQGGEDRTVREELSSLEKEDRVDRGALEETYRKAFRVRIPLLGEEPALDLRTWIYALPFLFILSEVYLSILRKQVGLLARIAAHRIARQRPDEVSAFDRLEFSNDERRAPPFARHPSEMFAALYLAGHLALGVYFIEAGRPFWRDWETPALISVVPILLAAIFYALAYTLHVGAQLDAQAEAVAGVTPVPSRLRTTWEKTQRWALRVTARLRPTPSLATGTLLVGVTLFLGFSVNSCGAVYRGWDLARGWAYEKAPERLAGMEYPKVQREADEHIPDETLEKAGWQKRRVYWPSVYFLSDVDTETGWVVIGLRRLERACYLASLLLAALTLLLLVAARAGSRILSARRVYAWAFVAALPLAVFTITDFGLSLCVTFLATRNAVLLYSSAALFPVNGAVILASLGPSAFAGGHETPANWPERRALLIVLYTPWVAAAAGWTMFVAIKLYAVPAYFIGLNLLVLGYWRLARRSREPSEIAEAAARPAA